MLRYSEEKILDERNVSALYFKVDEELINRRKLYERVRRKLTDSELASITDEDIKIPLERYISVTATGYFGGKAPKYKVHAYDEEVSKINKDIFDFEGNDEEGLKEIEQIIAHITDYNDDDSHHLKMVWDFLTKRACYELYYKNEYGEYVYSNVDALEAVAIWDYSIPKNLIGLYRIIRTVMANGEYQTMVELTTKKGKFYYNSTPEKIRLFKTPEYENKFGDEPLFVEDKDKAETPKWDDVPFTAIETEENLAIFEPTISLIRAYERVIQNSRNIHQYNDLAKLVLVGMVPENSGLNLNKDGTYSYSDLRLAEDKARLEARVIYLQEDGDARWLTKDINDSAIENHKKTLIDLICLCSFVPNMTDLGFTQADNNSALEKKFFNLQQYISTFKGEFKKAYTRRWEVILNKINIDKSKNYDFRDIEIVLNVNLPTDTASETSRAMQLRDLLSDETIINMLPDDLDAKNEIAKKKNEAEQNLIDNQELMQQFSESTTEGAEEGDGTDIKDNADEQLSATPGEIVKGSKEKEQEEKPDAVADLDKLKK